jgi:hypothetical protein
LSSLLFKEEPDWHQNAGQTTKYLEKDQKARQGALGGSLAGTAAKPRRQQRYLQQQPQQKAGFHKILRRISSTLTSDESRTAAR